MAKLNSSAVVAASETAYDAVICWNRLNSRDEPVRSVSLLGNATRWNVVPMTREDNVLQGTAFRVKLCNLQYAVEYRFKFVVDGKYTIDDNYPFEEDDGYGMRNNIMVVSSRPPSVPCLIKKGRLARSKAGAEAVTTHLPQDMIKTAKLYQQYLDSKSGDAGRKSTKKRAPRRRRRRRHQKNRLAAESVRQPHSPFLPQVQHGADRPTLHMKPRHSSKQAGTLTLCEGLSIHELEGRVRAAVLRARHLASPIRR